MVKKQKTIGILGGLGPEASNWLAQEITRITPATKDQDHLRVIHYNNPKIPDRTEAIVKGGQSPVLNLVQSAEVLEQAGADFIIIPCNTSHYYLNDIQKYIDIPIINMIEETAKYIVNNYPNVKVVGLLATAGTVESGVYDEIFTKYNIDIITPTQEDQEEFVTEGIYGEKGVKAGYIEYPQLLFEHMAKSLVDDGAQVVITGCTEIGLAMDQQKVNYKLIDPAKILAHVAVEKAINEQIKSEITTFVGELFVQPYYFFRRKALEIFER
ncbi:MAG: amino acid racemase [archaeon]